MKRGRIHATAGYVHRLLKERPDMLPYVCTPETTMEEALAELEAMPPDKLVSCGHNDCEDCGGGS